MTNNWYVLTGGPCSGKTSLLLELKKRGFHTSPEAARSLIDEYQNKGISIKDVRKDNDFLFQNNISKKLLELENAAPANKVVFFDRGIVDCIAYFQMLYDSDLIKNNSIDKKLIDNKIKEFESIAKNRYNQIFFLNLLDFENDKGRIEDMKIASKLSDLTLKAYEKIGYDVIKIPVVSIKERADLILQYLLK